MGCVSGNTPPSPPPPTPELKKKEKSVDGWKIQFLSFEICYSAKAQTIESQKKKNGFTVRSATDPKMFKNCEQMGQIIFFKSLRLGVFYQSWL